MRQAPQLGAHLYAEALDVVSDYLRHAEKYRISQIVSIEIRF